MMIDRNRWVFRIRTRVGGTAVCYAEIASLESVREVGL